MATIHIIQGPDKDTNFELIDGQNIIGRQGDHIPLSDGTTSRRHAQLFRQDEQWFIEDLGSANGTFVNGIKIARPMPMKPGDQMRCGSTLMVFTDTGELNVSTVDVDEEGNLVDAAIIATIPSNEDSVIMPSLEAGTKAINSLRILYDLINDVSSIFNIDLMLRQTLNKITGVMRVDRGYIMLIDKHGKLSLKASSMAGETGLEEIPISRTIINEVVSKQVGVLSSNAMGDKRFASGKSVQNFGIRSAICVPIKGRKRILGVIHVDCSVSEHTYTTEQLRLLTAIGYQTGLAIDNIALYDSAVQSERLAAVGETIASLSHHIKNVLQALDAGVEVVEMGLKRRDISMALESWPIVQRSLARLNSGILNMLAFSKDRQPYLEPTNVNHVIEECIEMNSHLADERGVALMSDMDDLPPIPADSQGLERVIQNLISNALDAVTDQTGVITVSSEYDSMNRQVIMRMMDNGCGIEEELRDIIFTPFYSSKGNKGTGLGLAVTKKIVNEHQGQITVESKLAEGATFTITLPAIHKENNKSGDTNTPMT